MSSAKERFPPPPKKLGTGGSLFFRGGGEVGFVKRGYGIIVIFVVSFKLFPLVMDRVYRVNDNFGDFFVDLGHLKIVVTF